MDIDYRDAKHKNYYIKNNKAYTEDHVLVYNIFVYKLPKKITEGIFMEYFQQYGKVTRCKLQKFNRKRKFGVFRRGFIDYEDPAIAAKVLQEPHTFAGGRFLVKASDSWRQPNANFTNSSCVNMEVTTETNGDSSINTTLIQLNDDCLELICKKLFLKDQISFARVCQKFEGVFIMSSKVEYKNFEMNGLIDLTLWETHDFFRLAGSGIELLQCSLPFKDDERIINFISKYCYNVKKIQLSSMYMKKNLLRKLINSTPNVTELNLEACSVTDSTLKKIKRLPALQILGLKSNCELTGQHLNKFTNLKVLDLYGCSNIQSTFLIKALESLQHLTHLDVRRCERLSTSVYQIMAKSCKNLEELKMTCTENPYEDIARIPQLKRLELLPYNSRMSIKRSLFVQLVEHKSKQLEYLRIDFRNCLALEDAKLVGQLEHLKYLNCLKNDKLDDSCLSEFANLLQLEEIDVSYCNSITSNGLLPLLCECNNLKKINIQRCENINDEFVFQAINILQQRITKMPGPVIIAAGGSGISQDVLVAKELYGGAATKLITLKFDIPILEDHYDNGPYSDNDDYENDYHYEDSEDYSDYDADDFYQSPKKSLRNFHESRLFPNMDVKFDDIDSENYLFLL